jgi:hypothetical protein
MLEESLGHFELAMLAICTVGVLVLLARAYGIGVTKEGASGNPYADGHNLRFSSMRDDGAASAAGHKYDGLKARRNYDGMLGSAEPPVFWSNQYVDSEMGSLQGDGLDDDGSDDGSAWVSAGPNYSDGGKGQHAIHFTQGVTDGLKRRKNKRKEGMLDAALSGGNVKLGH